MTNHLNAPQMENIRHTIDMAAVVAAVWTVAGWLPPVAALFSIIWLGMQIVMNWDKFTDKLKHIFTKGNK